MKHTLALLLLSCTPGAAESEPITAPEVPESPGTRVVTAAMTASRAQLELELPGELTGARDALLASATGGFVEALLVRKGDHVKKKQALARIDTTTQRALRDQAAARQELAVAELARQEALGDMGTPARLEAAQIDVRVAASALKLARIQVSRSLIVAPFDGVVSQLAIEEGEIARPGSPVIRVIQLDPMEVTISVSDRDVQSLHPGMSVAITAQGEPLTGTITAIDPAADLKTRAFTVYAEVANPGESLLPGMLVGVGVKGAEIADAVILPLDWLVTRMDGLGVFVEQDLTARWRPVTTGSVVHDQVVITDGLRIGDRVVIEGHRGLVDGDKLIIARQGRCCDDGRVTFE